MKCWLLNYLVVHCTLFGIIFLYRIESVHLLGAESVHFLWVMNPATKTITRCIMMMVMMIILL